MSMNSFHSRNARPAPRKPAKDLSPRSRHGVRADQLAVDQGLAPSRATAQRLIAAGMIGGPHGPIAKPAQEWPPGTLLHRIQPPPDAA